MALACPPSGRRQIGRGLLAGPTLPLPRLLVAAGSRGVAF